MTLRELKDAAISAFELAEEFGKSPDEIKVSLQIDCRYCVTVWADEDVELHYDNDGMASGCVLTAYHED
jgi:hypothetical protein